MGILKTHDEKLIVGRNSTYWLTITNVGNVITFAPIFVSDALPKGLTLVDASGSGWSCWGQGLSDAHNARCVYAAPLEPGNQLVITVVVYAGPQLERVVVNTGVVSTEGDLDSSNDTSTHIDRWGPVEAPAASEIGLLVLIASLSGLGFFTLRSRLSAR